MKLRTRSVGSRYRKDLYKYYILCLTGVLFVLILELLLSSSPSFLGEEGLILLILLSIAILSYIVFLYISEDLEELHHASDDLVPIHVQRQAFEARRAFETARQRTNRTSQSPIRTSQSLSRTAALAQSDGPVLTNPSLLSTAEKLRGITAKDSFLDDKPESLKISGDMRDWIERIRQHLAKALIPMVLTAHVENALLLNQVLRLFTREKEQRWVYEGSFTESLIKLNPEEKEYCKKVSLNDIKLLAVEVGCNSQADLQGTNSYSIAGADGNSELRRRQQSRVAFVDALRQRYALERFFEVPGYAARDYVVERLQRLCATSCLSGFSSFAGGTQQSGKWTSRCPTDSHIIANLWFAMLTNGNNATADPAFQLMPPLLHVYPAAPPFSNDPSKVFFYQKNPEEKVEPHYDVVSGNELWPGVRGTENIFSAIALFLVHVKTKGLGYFHKMSCKDLMHLIRERTS